MDTATRELIEACRLATEPTGIETPTYLWFMSHEEQWMALDQVMTMNGLTYETIKFCFWLEDDMKRIEKELFARTRGTRAAGVVETHNEYDKKINAAQMPVLDFIKYSHDADIGRDPEGYMWELVRRAASRAQSWQEREQRKVADAVRLAHATTKDAIRMRARRRAGKVKPRPPRPARTLEQNVEARRKAVETREAKLSEFKKNPPAMYIRDQLRHLAKAEKSIRSAKKALATAERKRDEALGSGS